MKKIFKLIICFALCFTLFGCANDDKDQIVIQEVYDSLLSNADLDNVTSNLSFHSNIKGVSIVWSSSDTSIISNTGTVTRGSENQTVTVTATLRYEELVMAKDFTITVLKQEVIDNTLENVKNNLLSNVSLTSVTSNLELPTLVNGVTITWTSSNPSILSNDGVVTRTDTDQSVTLTATLVYNDQNDTKIFNVLILKVEEEIESKEEGFTNNRDVYSLADSASVKISGNVSAIMRISSGTFIYLHDSTGDITVFIGTKSTLDTSSISSGDYLRVEGTKTTYNSLVEVSATSIEKVVGKEQNVLPTNVSEVSEISDVTSQGKYINLVDFTVSSVYEVRSNNDATITLSDGKDTVVLFFKADIINSLNSVIDTLQRLQVGDTLTIKNLVVTSYKGLQVYGLSGTTVEMKVQNNITVSQNEFVVSLNTSIEDILSSITVSLVGEENRVLTSSEYSISGNYNSSAIGKYEIIISYNNEEYQAVINVEVVDESSLADALTNHPNYTLTYTEKCECQEDSESNYESSITYKYTSNADYYVYDGYDYYVSHFDGQVIGIYQDDTKTNYYGCYEGTESFELYFNQYSVYLKIDFSTLNANDFTYDNGYYVCKQDKLQNLAKSLLGDYDGSDDEGTYSETFSSFKIKVSEGKIVEMLFTSLYIEDYGNNEVYHSNFTYTLTFTNYDSTTVNLPTYTMEEETNNQNMTLEEVANSSNDTLVTTGGNITGILATTNNTTVYIKDETRSLTVFFTGNDVDYSSLKVGDYIIVSGKKIEYKGLIEVTKITSLEVVNEKFAVQSAQNVTNISEINSELSQGALVNLLNVTVTKVYSGTNDYSLSVSDGTNTISLFVKSSIASSFNDLSSYNVGDQINIYNVNISWYNNAQLGATLNTFVTGAQGLYVDKDTIKVAFGTSLEDAMKDVVVTLVDGTSTVLTSTDYSISAADYDGNVSGTYEITLTYNNNQDYKVSFKIIVKEEPVDAFIPTEVTRLDGVAVGNGLTSGIPSTGDVNVLVIPLQFTNQSVPTNYKNMLELAFNGTSDATGWHSLHSYYYISSYGKLNFSATIMDAYQTNEAYGSSNQDSGLDYKYLKGALEYYDNQLDYSNFDSDSDGYIDCVYLIYLAPYNTTDDDSIWWAYTYEYYTDVNEYYDSVEADFYIWMSYDFLTDPIRYGESGKEDLYLTVNAETIIHESGHAIGLDDYYDYEEGNGPDGGIGGGDMMDYNVGDHNPYSKSILGWTTPTVVSGKDYTTTLRSFGESGECILIPYNWNGSFFAEYLIIDFYTPTGLNEIAAGFHGLFSESGVRIYHVDATLKSSTNDMDNIWYMTEYDNSYTSHRLISLVEADGDNSISNNYYGNNSDLFKVGSTFANGKWYDNSECGFTITVNSITEEGANITIDFE